MLVSIVGELENIRPFHLFCGHLNAVNIQRNVLAELGVFALPPKLYIFLYVTVSR